MENHNFLMGKSTICMAMFNRYVSFPEGIRKNVSPETVSIYSWGGQMGASLYYTVTKKVPEDHRANPNWFVCNWGLSVHLGELKYFTNLKLAAIWR